MEQHGFQQDKLRKNLDRLLSGWTQSGHLPCVQAMVIRNGELAYENAFGFADVEAQRPLRKDAIFRIYSMSKVFTSVCMMILYEEGRFKMYDPLSRFIPEFKNVKVTEYSASGQINFVAPRREIVIRDLFTMASGLPYPGGESPSARAMERVFEQSNRENWDGVRIVREMAKVPLTAHPGEHWWYGVSIDVLGALVEIISGQKFSEFLDEHICRPLGLTDTGFFVPEDKQDRFVSMYTPDENGRYVKEMGNWANEKYHSAPAYESGGGGMVSTAADVAKFAQMLVNFGEYNGVQILSRKSVELMRMNHLTDRQLKDYDWENQRGYGYGLAVRTMMHPEMAGYGSVGEFGWDGMAGTWFSMDPSEHLVMVFLVQINPGNHYNTIPYFAQTVYGAISD